MERIPTAAEKDNQWRARMKPDAPSPSTEESAPASPAAAPPNKAAERPRLNLQKRTVSELPQADAAASSDSKSSPFGAARPIDTSAREREVAEKREIAIRQKKEADDKAREEKKAREAAAKAAVSSPTDSAREPSTRGPRNNDAGHESDRKGSQADNIAPGKQFEILRREDGEGEDAEDGHDATNANMNGEIVHDKEVKPQEVTRKRPSGGSNNWRKGSTGPAAADATTAEQLDDDGFTVVSAGKKKGRSGGRALAS